MLISIRRISHRIRCEFSSKISFDFNETANSLWNYILISPKIQLYGVHFQNCTHGEWSKTVFLQIKQIYFCFDWLLGAAKYFAAKKEEPFSTFLWIHCEIKNQNCSCLDPFISDFAANSLRNSPRIRCEIRLVEISLSGFQFFYT